MCGIAGFVEFKAPPDERNPLPGMIATLAHRGPEGQGIRLVSVPSPSGGGAIQVGLGHTRLRVIDTSDASDQPMGTADGLIWVTFNGEIYNYRELQTELKAQGVSFRTSSDTEVLLRLYEREGERSIRRLEGMFAFAIWDGRRKLLLLARDRVGKKPIFYLSTPARFAFASEIKGLLAHPEILPEVDPQTLPAFFFFGYVPTPNTLYRGIQKLPPGHFLRLNLESRLQIEEFWDLPIAMESGPRRISEKEVIPRLRELVSDAVRRRLISDVPLGAFLSGGIDSSIVVGLMSRLMREPVRTFSIGFAGDPRFDETAYARLVSKKFGTIHQEFVVEPSSADGVERLVWHHDGPFADSSALPTYLLSRLTKEHVTVALNGDGGDELFAGYLRFPAALISERIPVWMRRAAHRLLSRLPEWGGHRSPLRRLQRFAAGAHLPFIDRYSRWAGIFVEDLSRLIPPGRDNGQALSPGAFLEPTLRRCQKASPLTQLLYLNLKTYLLDDLLVKMDRCSMAHGLEARSPFLDRALMEYVFTLPDSMKLKLGRTKVILRRAFADLLPPAILHRSKMGFAVPLQKWFAGQLREFLCDRLLDGGAHLRQYLDQGYVRQLLEDHLSHRADHSHRLWTLLTFEVWLHQMAGWRAHPKREAALLRP